MNNQNWRRAAILLAILMVIGIFVSYGFEFSDGVRWTSNQVFNLAKRMDIDLTWKGNPVEPQKIAYFLMQYKDKLDTCYIDERGA